MLHGSTYTIRTGFDAGAGEVGRGVSYQTKRSGAGQEDAKAGGCATVAAQTAKRNPTVVLLDDAFTDPQAQAGTLGRFCAEERFKEPF